MTQTSEFDLPAAVKRLAEAEPFASLRVPCLQSNHHSYLDLPGGCPSCLNRAWIPEPDVEKAVERVVENFAVSTRDEWFWFIVFYRMDYEQVGFKEAVLRVAETWVAAKEQHEPS